MGFASGSRTIHIRTLAACGGGGKARAPYRDKGRYRRRPRPPERVSSGTRSGAAAHPGITPGVALSGDDTAGPAGRGLGTSLRLEFIMNKP
jgi:hypothetical protein